MSEWEKEKCRHLFVSMIYTVCAYMQKQLILKAKESLLLEPRQPQIYTSMITFAGTDITDICSFFSFHSCKRFAQL